MHKKEETQSYMLLKINLFEFVMILLTSCY